MKTLLRVAVCSIAPALAQDSHRFGPVKPSLLPDVTATRHDGMELGLRRVFHGKRTALSFVFTNCRTACPLLGSVFKKVDASLQDPAFQLVSISVDAEHDSPAVLNRWLRSHGASERWSALTVRPADLPTVLAAFGLREGPRDAHSVQVYLVDEQARVRGRTTALPQAIDILRELGVGSEAVQSRASAVTMESGEDIYFGRTVPAAMAGSDSLSAAASRCANCHGDDRQGTREGRNTVPALTRGSLSMPVARRGGPPSSYRLASFCHALRTGVDPASVVMSKLMPRYEISDAGCRLLWQFLVE